MSYRVIDFEIWQDSWFDNLSHEAKLVFIFLFSSPNADRCGTQQYAPKLIGYFTGISRDKVEECVAEMSDKVSVVDGRIFCHSFIRHQCKTGNFKAGMVASFKTLSPAIQQRIIEVSGLSRDELNGKHGSSESNQGSTGSNSGSTQVRPTSNPVNSNKEQVTSNKEVRTKSVGQNASSPSGDDASACKPATSDVPKAKRKAGAMVDEEFLKSLESANVYAGINIRHEYEKMEFWLNTPRGAGKFPTKARFLNWLNRAEPTERKGNANGSTNQKPINQIACPSGSTDRGMAAIERMRENVRKRAELREARRLQGEDHPTGGTGNGNALPGVPQAPAGERGPSATGGDPRTGPASPIHAGVTSEKVRGPDAGKLDGQDAEPAPRS